MDKGAWRATVYGVAKSRTGLSDFHFHLSSVQLCSVAQSYLTLCDSMNRSMPGFPVLYCLLRFAQTHAH